MIDQKWPLFCREVVGNQYGDRYYPSMSGVARSLNYYPLGDEKAEEGTNQSGTGIGKVYRGRRNDTPLLSLSSPSDIADQ